jgi:hypothetical protein
MPEEPDNFLATISVIALQTQTHAGEAIYGAALVESELERMLLTYMPTVSNNLARRLFDGFGPLNTFSAKIDLSRALGLINADTYRDLCAVQAIRNAYAHPRERLHFQSAKIQELAKAFKEWRPNCDARELYDTVVVNLIAVLDMKTNSLIMSGLRGEADEET